MTTRAPFIRGPLDRRPPTRLGVGVLVLPRRARAASPPSPAPWWADLRWNHALGALCLAAAGALFLFGDWSHALLAAGAGTASIAHYLAATRRT